MSPRPALDFRVSFAQGIRAPQVFDEDLHIASLGGEARVVRIDPGLRPERSVNWMAGGEWKPALWGGQALLEVNGFHTRLRDQFHLQEDDLPETDAREFLKVNLGTATVRGMEANAGWGRGDHLVLQGGLVVQRSTFGQPDPDFASTRFFRTPDVYGNASIAVKEVLPVDVFAGIRITGPMVAPALCRCHPRGSPRAHALVRAGRRVVRAPPVRRRGAADAHGGGAQPHRCVPGATSTRGRCGTRPTCMGRVRRGPYSSPCGWGDDQHRPRLRRHRAGPSRCRPTSRPPADRRQRRRSRSAHGPAAP